MAEDDKVAKAQDEEEAGKLENDEASQQQEVEEAEESEKDKGANEQGEEDAEQSENEEGFPEQEVEETEESENDKGAKERIEEDAEQLPNDKVTQDQETEETEELENGKGAKEQVEEDADAFESDKVASQQRKEDVDESENEENTELDQEVDVDGETKQAPDVDEIECSGAASAINRTVAELVCETQGEPFVRRKSQRLAKRSVSSASLGISQMTNARGAKEQLGEDAEELENDKAPQEQEPEEREELENGKGAKEQVELYADEFENDNVASQQKEEDGDESENEEDIEFDQEGDVDGETKQALDVDEIGCSGAASANKRTVSEVEPFVRRKSQRLAKRAGSSVALGISQMTNAITLPSRSVRSPNHQHSVKSDEDGGAEKLAHDEVSTADYKQERRGKNILESLDATADAVMSETLETPQKSSKPSGFRRSVVKPGPTLTPPRRSRKDLSKDPTSAGSLSTKSKTGTSQVVAQHGTRKSADENVVDVARSLAVNSLPSKEAVAKPGASRSAKTSAKTTSHMEVSSAADVQVVSRKHRKVVPGDISAGQPVPSSAVRAVCLESAQKTSLDWQKKIDAAKLRKQGAMDARNWDLCIALEEELVQLQDMFVRSQQDERSTMELYDTKVKDATARLESAKDKRDFQSCKRISAELEFWKVSSRRCERVLLQLSRLLESPCLLK